MARMGNPAGYQSQAPYFMLISMGAGTAEGTMGHLPQIEFPLKLTHRLLMLTKMLEKSMCRAVPCNLDVGVIIGY